MRKHLEKNMPRGHQRLLSMKVGDFDRVNNDNDFVSNYDYCT